MAYCTYTDIQNVLKETLTAAQQTYWTGIITIADDLINNYVGRTLTGSERGVKSASVVLSLHLGNSGNQVRTSGERITGMFEIPEFIKPMLNRIINEKDADYNVYLMDSYAPFDEDED